MKALALVGLIALTGCAELKNFGAPPPMSAEYQQGVSPSAALLLLSMTGGGYSPSPVYTLPWPAQAPVYRNPLSMTTCWPMGGGSTCSTFP